MNTNSSDTPRRPGSPVDHPSPPAPGSRGRDALRTPAEQARSRTRLWAILAVGAVSVACATGWSAQDGDRGAAAPDRAPAAAELAPGLTLPVEVNERVDRWIQRYLNEERITFQDFMARENLYAPMIRRKLRERGMPEDLLYMAMIESGFSARATSHVQASGLWQFMGPTARHYGLHIGPYVDERRDPVRATDAALDYLEELHARFGSWYLAAAAYNAGPNRVARSVARYDGEIRDDEELFWKIVDDLPRETREYVPKLLAATLLAKEAYEYGFDVERRSEPYHFDRVWVPESTSLSRLARAVDQPVSLLRDLNPHLIRGETPPGTSFGVRVPPGSAPRVVASLGRTWSLVDDD